MRIPPTARVDVEEPAVLAVNSSPVKLSTPPFPSVNVSVMIILVSGTLPVFSTKIV